jgi:hypothetical protein
MQDPILVKSVGSAASSKNRLLFGAFAASILLNILSVAFVTSLPVRGDYRQVYALANAENDRLSNENADLRVRLVQVDPPQVCDAPPRAEPVPVAAFDAVDPQSVYYGCLDLMSRLGPFGDEVTSTPYRRYVFHTCEEAAEWSARHPGEPSPLYRMFGR